MTEPGEDALVLLDTSVVIGFFEANDAHHRRATELLQRLATRPWGVAELTVAEFLVAPAREGRQSLIRARNAMDDLEITELELPSGWSISLARLRSESGLKVPDCLVLLTAEHHQAALVTFDEKLAAVARQRGCPTLDC